MSNAQDSIQNLVTCQDCGRQVPEGNLMIHHLRACVARARRPGCGNGEGGDDNEGDSGHNNHDETQPMEVDDQTVSTVTAVATPRSGHGDNDDDNDDDEVQIMEHSPRKSSPSSPARLIRTRSEDDSLLATPQGGMRRRRQRVASDLASGPRTQIPTEVVDLVNGDSPSPHESRGNMGSEGQWACPQCTLLNPKSALRCDACNFTNPERPPDSTRTERLLHDDAADDESSYMSHLAFVSGGALMGGLLGAAGSFLHGRDPLSAVAEGAMSGVMGGALLNEVVSSNRRSTRSSTRAQSAGETGVLASPVELMDDFFPNELADFDLSEQRQPISVAQARSSASISGGYPSMVDSSETSNQRSRPRSSFRVVREQGHDGSVTTIVMGGTSTTRIRRSQRGASSGIHDPMLSLLVHSYLEQQGHMPGRAGVADVDTMGYEDLLRAFGDGTENLGATEAQILSLPTKVIENPAKELPEEARQCLICLEDIAQGESRKILPCLHGFHADCCDKWLRTNGSCPICKHRIG